MSYLTKADGRLDVEYKTWLRSVSRDSRTSLDLGSNICTEDTSEESEAQSSSESETSPTVSASG